MKTMHTEQGFTIIELLIALALGALITLAAAQMFIISYKTSAAQQATAGIVDANVFGLQQIERSVRLAGYGLSTKSSGADNTSGILLNLAGSPQLRGGNLDASKLTKSEDTSVQTSNTQASQLTVQYRAPVDMRDCEGQLALGYRPAETRTSISANDASGNISNTASNKVDGQVVVERFYLKDNGKGGLDLYCDSGRYLREEIVKDNSTHPKASEAILDGTAPFVYVDRGTADGVLVIANVDDFQVLLGEKIGSNIQYKTPKEYGTSANPISVVKMSVLVRGDIELNTPDADKAQNPRYYMFGKEVTLNSTDNYLRRVYESNIVLRNARD